MLTLSNGHRLFISSEVGAQRALDIHANIGGVVSLSEPKTPLIATQGTQVDFFKFDRVYMDGEQLPRDQLDAAIKFIHSCFESHKDVLVHCCLGKSRTPYVVVCYLMKHQSMSYGTAIARLRNLWPRTAMNYVYEAAIRPLGRTRSQSRLLFDS